MAPLLVELLVEELPPKSLQSLGEEFGRLLVAGLLKRGLVPAPPELAHEYFASPRRLAVLVSGALAKAADVQRQTKLMPRTVGLGADGRPTASLLKKLASIGADASAVESLSVGADGALYLDRTEAGATLVDGLQQALGEAVAKLPIRRLMQYQLADGWTSVHFVRPAHGLVALHGDQIVPVSALGLESGRVTRGHRFEASRPEISLRSATSYAAQLRDEGAVIASFAERRAELKRQVVAAATREGLRPIDDEALLDEVTGLVERPNVLLCRFEPEFLVVPQECLILTMKANQKYFPLLDGAGRLTEKFLVASNIHPFDPSRVIEGNERVVRPRLADARFFYEQDGKKTLASRVPLLARVVYHGRLGSQADRVERVRAIARAIGQQLGGASLAALADRAAQLAKADLLTDMVGEFPELQGVMGGYYARHDGEPEAVAQAIEDHYRPRFAGDGLPRGEPGLVVALADKLESLVGLFGIGQAPTGDKDPFALRRHALGVIRMIVEGELPLDAIDLLEQAALRFDNADADAAVTVSACFGFLLDRLSGWLRERGAAAQEVDAVLALRPSRWADLSLRLAAVRAFASLPEAAALAAANKRVGNILRKSDDARSDQVDPQLLVEPAEAALAEALLTVGARADAALAAGDPVASLQALAALKTPVDAFFDAVMVNADDPALRRNRLTLLTGLHAAMNRVADLSRLAA